MASTSASSLLAFESRADGFYLCLSGRWTWREAAITERAVDALIRTPELRECRALDMAGVAALDTAGALLINRLRASMLGEVRLVCTDEAQSLLLTHVHYKPAATQPAQRDEPFIDAFVDVGETVVDAGRDFYATLSFFGELTSVIAGLFRSHKWRMTSIVYHIESFAWRGLPVIALINFLVGCIVAQQGIFQLRRFGAAAFAVDLIGILVLRELAVLLTSIMVAGRSGSAITAEIGSMKMREEIDALRVMGLNPMDVLVVPRLIALIICLPLLTFVSDMAALFGGLLVSWFYGDLSPAIFLSRLQSAIALNTFLVGLIKAPIMALAIGLIAVTQGLAVGGSAESLGRQVTASVVKSIFMVIVIDGLFAMFFAAIRY
jgi:phospholipid/cholesterol/gamma-HCH transport system permease protein